MDGVPGKSMPAAVRTVLPVPSQPTRYAPSISYVPSGPITWTVTARPVSVNPVTRCPRTIVAPRPSACSWSSSSVRAWGRKRVYGNGVSSSRKSSRLSSMAK